MGSNPTATAKGRAPDLEQRSGALVSPGPRGIPPTRQSRHTPRAAPPLGACSSVGPWLVHPLRACASGLFCVRRGLCIPCGLAHRGCSASRGLCILSVAEMMHIRRRRGGQAGLGPPCSAWPRAAHPLGACASGLFCVGRVMHLVGRGDDAYPQEAWRAGGARSALFGLAPCCASVGGLRIGVVLRWAGYASCWSRR